MSKAKQQQREKLASHTRFEEFSKRKGVEEVANESNKLNSSSGDSDQEMGNTAAAGQSQEAVEENATEDPSPAAKVKKGRKRKRKSIGLEVASNSNVTEAEAKAEAKAERKRERKL